MMSEFENNYNEFISKLSQQDEKIITEKMKLYMAVNGNVFIDKSNKELTHIIPVTLFPSPLPKELFQEVKVLQTHINDLLYKVSKDYDFIVDGLKEVCETDEFTKKLVDIYKEVHDYVYSSKIDIGIIRSDYMTHDVRKSCCDLLKLYLVEYNTISASFGAHGSQISAIHSDILFHIRSMFSQPTPVFTQDVNKLSVHKDIGETLATGWNSYVKKYSPASSCLIFVIQENERNIFDHLKIESSTIRSIDEIMSQNRDLKQPPKILFLTLQQLHNRLKVDESCGAIYYYLDENHETKTEVTLFYFRSCYTPNDCINNHCWEIRKIIELSRSIKVPSIGLQLAGTKKVQQLLAVKGTLEKYLPEEISNMIGKTYTGIYSLNEDNTEVAELLENVKQNPSNYVLKPQREGGGNNLYGQEMVQKIQENIANHQNLNEFIIMDMIQPAIYKNYLIHCDSKTATLCDCISELGLWGMYVMDEKGMTSNKSSGYLLRSKSVKQLDGGVASGRAVLDSVCLF